MKTVALAPSQALPRGDIPHSEGGIALIIVMISIFVLSMLAGGFAYSMKVETRLARNANSETELEWLGRSGVEKARWILAEQLKITQEPYDGLDQVWAGGAGGIGTSNSPLAQVSLTLDTDDGGHADISIVDLERKANINTADEAILKNALMVVGADAGQMDPIVGSILDWIDPDDNTHVQGAENDYYQGLQPPYFAKNGPIDDISELLLIKGIRDNPDLYWGPSSSNHAPTMFQAQRTASPFAQDDMPTYQVGLADLFTPLSDGKININTASAAVLQLIPGIDPIVAEGIVAARAGQDDGSGLVGPYRTLNQIQRVPELPWPGLAARQIQQYCDVRSRTFEVHVNAQVNGYHRYFVAVLGRNNPRDVQILKFYWSDRPPDTASPADGTASLASRAGQ